MYTWISGTVGPFQNSYLKGNFGANAATNVIATGNSNPRQVLNSHIEYSPMDTEDQTPADKGFKAMQKRDDALGYARQDLLYFYYKNRGLPIPAQPTYQEKLDVYDLAKIFGDMDKAKQFLKAVDTGGEKTMNPDGSISSKSDGLVSIPEMAAYILFTDDSITQMRGALKAFSDPTIMSSPAAQPIRAEMQKAKDYFRYYFPDGSKADGVLTPREREAAEFGAFNMPTTTRFVLKQFEDVFQLDQTYAATAKPIVQPGGSNDNGGNMPGAA